MLTHFGRRLGGLRLLLLIGGLLAACQGALVQRIDPAGAPVGTPLPPRLPTGIHLQGLFNVPAEFEGHPTTHREMRYLLYLPQEYYGEAERDWPLILFLHGSGDDDYDSGFVMSYGLPEVLYLGEQPQDFPFVVVSPQAFPGETWWSSDTQLVLAALLEEILQTYRVDPARVYLTGLSMGGYGSWHLATTYPDRFAAMISISGSGYWTIRSTRKDFLCRMKDLPVWAIHGAQDNISIPQVAESNLKALGDSCRGEVRWTLYPDQGHLGAAAVAYRDPELYAWLLAHAR